jgi:predicted lipoprotein with Yx(FWY)xxD motif
MAIKTTPLTATQIKNVKTTGKDITLTDGGGLILLAQNMALRYDKPGTSNCTTLTLGNYPELSLADARERRKQAKALLARDIDPQHHKQLQQEADEIRRGNTFQKVATDWYEMKKAKIWPLTP